MANEPVRLGIVGCGRGASFLGSCATLGVEVAAVCDVDEAALAQGAKRVGAAGGNAKSYTDFEKMLEQSRVNAVLIAAPMPLHVSQSIMALERGIHVLSEVPAGVSIEECQKLVLACRSSKAIYAMGENYIYTLNNMLIGELVRRKMFGTVYYAEAEYIHELKAHNEKTPWRRKWQTGVNGATYATHSLGPILQWMAGDRVTSVCCAGSGHHYKDPRGADYENEDSIVMLCKMASGGLVKIRVDMLSERPHAMTNYQLQGTEGCYESARAGVESGGAVEADRIWLKSRGGANPDREKWERLETLRDEFMPALWREAPEAATKSGHGGGDYFVLADFVNVLRGKAAAPRIGIDAAMDLTLPGLASQQSILHGGRWTGVADSRKWISEDTLTRGSLHMILPQHLHSRRLEVRIPEGYQLRQYEPADEAKYAALMEKAGFGVWDHERVQKVFEATLSQGFFVIEHLASGALVATTMALHVPQGLHPHGGELAWVAADPEHRGKGLGTATCSAVVNLFAGRGYERIYLMTDDFRLPAITVYLRMGFEPSLHDEEMNQRWTAIRKNLAAYKKP